MSEHHHCACGHEHHEHNTETNKYEAVLAQYATQMDDAEVQASVKKIIAEKVHENDTAEVKRFLFGSIELTSLNTTDSDASILAFTQKVNQFDSA